MGPTTDSKHLTWETSERKVKVLVAQSGPTLCDPMDCSLARLLCPWNSPGKYTGICSHSLLQGIFLTLGLKGVIVSFLNHPHWAVDLQTLPAKSQAGNFRHSCTLKIFRNTEVREGSAFSDCSSPTAMI